MRCRAMLMVALLIAATITGCNTGGSTTITAADGRRITVPDVKADDFVLYSIDGTSLGGPAPPKGAALLHGCPILGTVNVKDAKTREALVAAFTQGVSRAEVAAKCFWPRHAIRTTSGGKSTDYVICFECSQLWIYRDGDAETNIPMDEAPQETFNAILKRAGVPLAPSAFHKSE